MTDNTEFIFPGDGDEWSIENQWRAYVKSRLTQGAVNILLSFVFLSFGGWVYVMYGFGGWVVVMFAVSLVLLVYGLYLRFKYHDRI